MDTIEARQLLAYPFDSAKVIRKKGALAKAFNADSQSYVEKRIAVLGGSTTQQMVDFLEVFLLAEGISPVFYQSSYARFWEDAVFGNDDFNAFNPDVIVVHTSVRNTKVFDVRDTASFDPNAWIKEDKTRFFQVWEALVAKFSCPIIHNNFERPPYRLLGNQDICDTRGMSWHVLQLNLALYEFAQQHETFFIHDIDALSAEIGLEKWHDSNSWTLYKNAFNVAVLPEFGYSLSRIIKALYGKNKKAVILDLDNTLWNGVIGDDGVSGVAMGTETAIGEKHRALQAYLNNVTSLGAILAVDSKNEMEAALEGLNHADSILPPDKFACIKANWNPKSMNMVEIAEDLNIGIDSFVFVDDNPAEREIINQQLPEVDCVAFDDVADVPTLITRAGYFEVTSYTEDDTKRAEMYRQNAQRKTAERAFDDYDAYLNSLEMVAEDVGFAEPYMARIAQLTNKTNQFNLTTKRFTEDDMRGFAEDGNHICLAVKLKDKFGDNGLVSVVVGEVQDTMLDIGLWLMSCRVMKRGLEEFVLNRLMEQASARGVEKVVGHYYPTKKNNMVRELYKDFGFTLIDEDSDGNSNWEYSVAEFEPRVVQIEGGQ